MVKTWTKKLSIVGPKGPKGEQGIPGERGQQGPQGEAAGIANVTATVANTTGSPTVTATSTGPDTAKVFSFAFAGLKGEKGDVGPQGLQGVQGPQGVKGETGQKGDAGPTGPQGIQGIQGQKGEKGDPFSIAKTFASVSAMNSGFATDGVKEGQFVMIDTGNVQDADNAKLYVKGKTAYTYITDLSGAAGVQGPQGIQGQQGVRGETGPAGPAGAKGADGAAAGFGVPVASVSNTVGTPTVVVKATGDNTAKVFDFAFSGIKGERGDRGETGQTGAKGADGNTILTGVGAPTIAENAKVGDLYLDTETGNLYAVVEQ